MKNALMNCYKQLPVSFSHGEGVHLFDEQGKSYLDALSGISVTNLGHSHPAVTQAIIDQASKLLHTSNVYEIPYQYQLANQLTKATQMDRAFFCNSGAEATEAVIKLARLYANRRKIENGKIIVMENAFHGRTLATISASGSRRVQAGFEPLVSGFIRAPFNDIEAIKNIAKTTKDIVAILLEPVQGESGVRVPNAGYLTAIRELCNQEGWLMMLDEIQSGMGRTGKLFAFQHEKDAIPDIMALAKAMANGYPMGACLARGEAAELFQPGNHGSTFGGNPMGSRIALTVLEEMVKNKLPDHAHEVGGYLLDRLQATVSSYEIVQEVRGKGLLIGIELSLPCREILHLGLEEGLLFSITAEKIIRLAPPLILEKSHADLIVQKIERCIKQFALSYEAQ